MTYEEVRKSGLPFNREIYKDGWYYVDRRNVDCSCLDLSQRFWTQEDLDSKDWILEGEQNEKEI
jgi:hypothetical protein